MHVIQLNAWKSLGWGSRLGRAGDPFQHNVSLERGEYSGDDLSKAGL